MKNFLLPREMDKLLKGFRQKHSNHPILRPRSAEDDEDDTSTIASDSAESLDDKGVLSHCRKDGDEVMKALFSGPLFGEIAWRNSGRVISDGPMLTLPPVGSIDHDKGGDVSDLESLHSSSSRLMDHKHPVYGRIGSPARRKR